MSRADLTARLRGVMEQSSPDAVDWEAVDENSTIASLGIDSLAMLDLTYDLQQEFHIEFEPEELIEVKTVGDLLAFLDQRLAT